MKTLETIEDTSLTQLITEANNKLNRGWRSLPNHTKNSLYEDLNHIKEMLFSKGINLNSGTMTILKENERIIMEGMIEDITYE